jgi:ABC-type uncharacterized transport system permease subunit
VLHKISLVFNDHINHLTVYQLTFIIFNLCEELNFHTDFVPTLVGQTVTVLIPLQVVEQLPPEVVLKQHGCDTLHYLQYRNGFAYFWGARTIHASGMVHYADASYRVCVSISIDINK